MQPSFRANAPNATQSRAATEGLQTMMSSVAPQGKTETIVDLVGGLKDDTSATKQERMRRLYEDATAKLLPLLDDMTSMLKATYGSSSYHVLSCVICKKHVQLYIYTKAMHEEGSAVEGSIMYWTTNT